MPVHERLDEQITGIRRDHRIDIQVEAAFNLIVREANAIDILVSSVWGGYEHMVENGDFTWPKPFWEQPLWRWDAMFSRPSGDVLSHRRRPGDRELFSYPTEMLRDAHPGEIVKMRNRS